MWADQQQQFARTLFERDGPLPRDIGACPVQPDRLGLDVYRNNIAVGLSGALAANFPVVAALVGDEFFSGMAGAYRQQCLPSTPVLHEYGRDFPDFIAAFPPAEPLPYLADIARLEWAWLRAYHAPDADPVSIDALSTLEDAAFETLRLELHPSTDLIRSDWPVVSIWRAHQSPDGAVDLSDIANRPENAAVLRPGLDVAVHVTDDRTYDFIAGLAAGDTLAVALEASCPDETDASAQIATLFNAGFVTGLHSS